MYHRREELDSIAEIGTESAASFLRHTILWCRAKLDAVAYPRVQMLQMCAACTIMDMVYCLLGGLTARSIVAI